MIFRQIFIASGLICAPTWAFALDAQVRQSLEAALATENPFVIKSTFNAAKAQFPDDAPAIEALRTAKPIKTAEKPAQPAPVAPAKPKAKTAKKEVAKPVPQGLIGWFKAWEGQVEAGGEFASGNVDRQSVRAAINAKRTHKKWRHTVNARARNIHEDDERVNEDYTLRGRSDYKLNKRLYTFGEAEWVKDPFSGYDYRVTESVGLGYQLVKTEDVTFEVRGSVGGRHSQTTAENADVQHEVIYKPATSLDWQITDSLSFEQTYSSTIGSEAIVTEFNNALSNKLTDSLFLKVALEIDHVSDVAPDTKKTDTLFTINLAYDF